MALTHLPPPRIPATPLAADRRLGRDARRFRHRVWAVLVRAVVPERRLGRLLDRELGPVAVVLHARTTASGDPIDHLVVAASGVWVIEGRHDPGRLQRRRRDRRRGEAWLRRPAGDREPLLSERRAVDDVQTVLDRIGFGWLEAQRVVCCTNARWGVRRSTFRLDGALVTRRRALVDRIGVPGPVGPQDMRAVAAVLDARLPRTPGRPPREADADGALSRGA